MRIISGSHKGRIIKPGKFFKHRPTTDIAKEALFNILQNQIDFEGITVLDLFAGTGSISYEFASRGAREVTAVERNFKYTRFIQQSGLDLGMENVAVKKADVFSFLKTTGHSFDVIFADPPYDLEQLSDLPDLVIANNWLTSSGLFILEHPRDYTFSSHQFFTSVRSYGSVHFSFFENSK